MDRGDLQPRLQAVPQQQNSTSQGTAQDTYFRKDYRRMKRRERERGGGACVCLPACVCSCLPCVGVCLLFMGWPASRLAGRVHKE